MYSLYLQMKMLKTTRTDCLRLSLCALLLAGLYPGISSPEVVNNNYLNVSLALKFFDYKEFNDAGLLLDEEKGVPAGISLSYERKFSAFSVIVEGDYFDGVVDYSGQTQGGIPINTRSDSEIKQLSVYLLRWEKTENQLKYAPYTGIGYYNWIRNIRPTVTTGGAPVAGLLEDYTISYIIAGVRLEIFNKYKTDWHIDLRVNKMLNAKINVDFLNYAGFDKASLEIGNKYGFRISAPWEKKISNNTWVSVNPYYEKWKFGKSNSVQLTINGLPSGTTILEPGSATSNSGINIGMRIAF